MPFIVKISGNYSDVTKALLPPSFHGAHLDIKTINCDIDRTLCISYFRQIDSIKERLRQTKENYTQGDWSGAVFTETLLMPLKARSVEQHDLRSDSEPISDNIQFTFEDDDSVLSGFSLSYLKEKPSSKKACFIMTLVKYVDAPIHQRRVVVYSEANLLADSLREFRIRPPRHHAQQTIIDVQRLPYEISTVLNSRTIQHLISPLLHSFNAAGYFVLSRPNSLVMLKSRLKPGQNLDDRDQQSFLAHQTQLKKRQTLLGDARYHALWHRHAGSLFLLGVSVSLIAVGLGSLLSLSLPMLSGIFILGMVLGGVSILQTVIQIIEDEYSFPRELTKIEYKINENNRQREHTSKTLMCSQDHSNQGTKSLSFGSMLSRFSVFSLTQGKQKCDQVKEGLDGFDSGSRIAN